MKILGFGKDDDDIFKESKRENDDMSKDREPDNKDEVTNKRTDGNIDDENIESGTEEYIEDDYIDPDDLEYCEYGDIVDTIEENGWALTSSAGLNPITHFDTNIIRTKQCKRNSYEDVLEIICPPGNIITICGFNQEDIDKDSFFNSPNLYTRPHFFTIKLTDDSNNEIPYTTIIGMSLINREGNAKKIYEEFYGDLSPIIDGKLKRKGNRYYFAETIVLQGGEKLVLHAYWPLTDITKIELLMIADLFIREE